MTRPEPHHDHGFSAWVDSLHLGDPSRTVELVISLLSLLFVFSVLWVFFDARARQKSGCIAMLFILLVGWPLSFLWWFWLRPPLERGPVRRRRA